MTNEKKENTYLTICLPIVLKIEDIKKISAINKEHSDEAGSWEEIGVEVEIAEPKINFVCKDAKHVQEVVKSLEKCKKRSNLIVVPGGNNV